MRGWIALAALALALSGCGGGDAEKTMIDWDLSHSHTADDVDWSPPDLDATSVKPEGAVRIKLPGGREFEAPAGEIHEIFMRREGATLKEIQLNASPSDAAGAHATAARWATEWDLPTKNLDGWFDQAQDGGYVANAQTSAPPKDGFEVAVKLLSGSGGLRAGAPAIGFAWLRGAPGSAPSGT